MAGSGYAPVQPIRRTIQSATLQQIPRDDALEQQIQRAQQYNTNPPTQSRIGGSYAEIPRSLGKGQQPTVARPDTSESGGGFVSACGATELCRHRLSPRQQLQEAWRIAQSHPAQDIAGAGTLAARITASGPRVSNAPAPVRKSVHLSL